MPDQFCTSCGETAPPSFKFGSLLSGVFIGIFFIIALCGLANSHYGLLIGGLVATAASVGIAYLTRRYYCWACGSEELIPANSPKALEFRDRQHAFETVQDRIRKIG